MPPHEEPAKPSGFLKRKAPNGASDSKRSKLPHGYKVSRRPLLRPALSSPFASTDAPKIVYMKYDTPFIPTVKRVCGLLKHIEKRETQSLSAGRRPLDARTVEAAIANAKEKRGDKPKEAVYVKATGRAIEKALGVGLYFQEEGGFGVRIETGTVEAVEDVVEVGKKKDGFLGSWVKKKKKKKKGTTDAESEGGGADTEMRDVEMEEEAVVEEIPETRTKALNFVNIAITLQ